MHKIFLKITLEIINSYLWAMVVGWDARTETSFSYILELFQPCILFKRENVEEEFSYSHMNYGHFNTSILFSSRQIDLRYLMFFQDSYPLDKYFLKIIYCLVTEETDFIQPRLDLNLYLRIILNFYLPASTSKDLDTGMRSHPACCSFRRWLDFKCNVTRKILKTHIFVVFYLVALAGLNLLSRPGWPLHSEIHLHLIPKCQDFKCEPLCLAKILFKQCN